MLHNYFPLEDLVLNLSQKNNKQNESSEIERTRDVTKFGYNEPTSS
jgi:hypothetical protein